MKAVDQGWIYKDGWLVQTSKVLKDFEHMNLRAKFVASELINEHVDPASKTYK